MHEATLCRVIGEDFKRTRRYFARALYPLAAAASILLLERMLGSGIMPGAASVEASEAASDASPGVTFLLSAVAFAAVLLFIAAVFKLYHGLIFKGGKGGDYFEALPAVKPLPLVLSKIIVAGGWLAGFLSAGFVMALARFDEARALFGEGMISVFSLFSLFLQALFTIILLYLACTACHMPFFRTYKTLAGIFVLVAGCFLENEIIVFLKRTLFSALGGADRLFSGSLLSTLTAAAAIDAICCVLMAALNVYLICRILHSRLDEPLTALTVTQT